MEHWRQAEPQVYQQNAAPARNATYDDYHDPYANHAVQPQHPHVDTQHAPGSQPDSPYEDPYATTGAIYPNYTSEPRPLPPHVESFESGYQDDATPNFQTNEQDLSTAPSQANLFNSTGTRDVAQSEKAVGPTFRPARSGGNVRSWRHDEHSKLWTKGGGVRTCARFCGCTILTILFLIFSLVLTLLLWVRPPDVTFNGIATDNKNPAVFSAESLTVDIGARISVANPNYFSVAFDQIKAEAFHPSLPKIPIGSGQVTNINFQSGHETSFTFPFEIKYIFSQDQDYSVLKDIAAKCGLLGSARSKLPLNYNFHVRIKGIAIPINVNGQTSIDCPLTDDQLKTLSGFSGIFGNGATPTPPSATPPTTDPPTTNPPTTDPPQ